MRQPARLKCRPCSIATASNRPPWDVAGVDYYVGVPSNVTLKDPAVQANLPAGASADPTNWLIRVYQDNVFLDGFDFSVQGGWVVYITANNVTI